VHQVGSIYKIIHGRRSTKHKKPKLYNNKFYLYISEGIVPNISQPSVFIHITLYCD
jgi:hypothetical protein